VPQTTVNLTLEDSYVKVKAALTQRGAVISSEDAPNSLVARQGSLWGISPKTAKKTIHLTLKQQDNQTTITYNSKLASDWKNVTIIGCFLSAILTAFCIWVAQDLSQFMVDGNPSFWAWLVSSHGIVKFQAGEALVNLSWGLAVFLTIVIVLEAAIYVYAARHLEMFAKETVDSIV
jgi:hypothetical protein